MIEGISVLAELGVERRKALPHFEAFLIPVPTGFVMRPAHKSVREAAKAGHLYAVYWPCFGEYKETSACEACHLNPCCQQWQEFKEDPNLRDTRKVLLDHEAVEESSFEIFLYMLREKLFVFHKLKKLGKRKSIKPNLFKFLVKHKHLKPVSPNDQFFNPKFCELQLEETDG